MLEVREIDTFYGVGQVLFGVSLSVPRGSLVALMGRNGMGKTTTIRSIMGLNRPRSGSITFEGQELIGQKAFRIAQCGIGLVPEGRRVFGPLTVEHNLLATERVGGAWTLPRVYALFPRLGQRADQLARTLSGGEQQMLAIGRALLTNPSLLILDEATEGLAPLVRQEIWAAIQDLKRDGLTLLVVDKNLRELTAVADRCVVLEKGRVAFTGGLEALAADQTMTQRYLGV
jgi:branched-chain amino acid transport system ATP-binding protein